MSRAIKALTTDNVIDGPWPSQEAEREPDSYLSTQVPPGRYLVGLTEVHKRTRFRREVFDVVFKVISDESGEKAHAGKQLPRFVNALRKTRRRSQRSTLVRDFKRIVGKLPPANLHDMKPEDIYSGCTLLVEVGFIEKDYQQDEVPAGARYSRIRKIVERVDGTPPYLRRLKVEQAVERS